VGAREKKKFDREIVVVAMESAIRRQGPLQIYGYDHAIARRIDRKTGEIQCNRYPRAFVVGTLSTPKHGNSRPPRQSCSRPRKKKRATLVGDFIIDSGRL